MNNYRYVAIFLLFFLQNAGFAESAESDAFVPGVSQAWMEGKKVGVMRIAESRVKQNPQDLASLLILTDYAVNFMDLDTLKVLFPLLRRVERQISTPAFSELKPVFETTIQSLEEFLPSVTKEMLESEAHKAMIPGKSLGTMPFLQALESDGLVARLTSNERLMLTVTGGQNNSPASGEVGNAPPLEGAKFTLAEIRKLYPSPQISLAEDRDQRIEHLGGTGVVSALVIALLLVGLAWFGMRKGAN